MFDYEKLIIEVESRPCVWNISTSDYHNKNMKSLAWNSICEAVCSDWDELSLSVKEERGKLFYSFYNKIVE